MTLSATPHAIPRAALLAGAVALLAACNPYVQGNGVLREETRPVEPFEGIVVEDGILATVTAGAAAGTSVAVTVSGDENIVRQSFETKVRSDPATGRPVLEVYVSTPDFSSTHPLRVSAAVPLLTLLRAKEASKIDATIVAVPELRVEASDGAIVTLVGTSAGEPDRLDVVLSGGQHGGAWLVGQTCAVLQADVSLRGASKAQLRASGSVTGTVVERSVLENTGLGPCDGVVSSADSTVSCASAMP